PELPTLAEAGLTGFDVAGWYAFFVPAHTSAAIVQKIYADTAAALADPTIKGRLEQLGLFVIGSTPAELGQFLKSEMDKWGPLIKEAGISIREGGRDLLRHDQRATRAARRRAGRSDEFNKRQGTTTAMRKPIATTMLGAASFLIFTAMVHADEIRVLSTQATEEAYRELVPQFEKASGYKVTTVFTGTLDAN